MRGLRCFLVAVSLMCFSSFPAHAIVESWGEAVWRANRTGNAAKSADVVFGVKRSSGVVSYKTLPVVYQPSTVGKLIRWGMSPAGLATVVAASAFFDWWVSQSGNDVDVDGLPINSPENGSCAAGLAANFAAFSCSIGWRSNFMEGFSQFKSCMAGLNSPTFVTSVWISGTSIRAALSRPSDGWTPSSYPVGSVASGGCNPGGETEHWNTDADVNPPPSWAPFLLPTDLVGDASYPTDEELASDLLSSPFADDDAVTRDLVDDSFGRPWDTPEVQDVRRQLRDDVAQEEGTDPSTLPPITTQPGADPTNPDSPSPSDMGWSDSVPPPAGSSSATATAEFPVFCDWVGEAICGWFGWTKEALVSDSPPSLPVEASVAGAWDSGLASGACPAPVVISALGASVPISWQPACDFVGMLRPILIAFAGIAAALILLGQRAGGAG